MFATAVFLLVAGCAAAPVTFAGDRNDRNKAFEKLLLDTINANHTLREYFLPPVGSYKDNLEKNWVPFSPQCKYSKRCHCSHVAGESASVDDNARPALCEHSKDVHSQQMAACNTVPKAKKNCECLTGQGDPCLYGHMSPYKLLLVVAAARAGGIDTIIEEGREGGLSAYMYARQGFNVISVEYLPLGMVKKGLTAIAPSIQQLEGDGAEIVPRLIRNMTTEQAARTLVIFDGEKRENAYKTYRKIRKHVAAAIFDDSQVAAGYFRKTLIEPSMETFVDTLDPSVDRLGDGVNVKQRLKGLLDQMKKWGESSPLWNFEQRYSAEHIWASQFIVVQSGKWRGVR